MSYIKHRDQAEKALINQKMEHRNSKKHIMKSLVVITMVYKAQHFVECRCCRLILNSKYINPRDISLT